MTTNQITSMARLKILETTSEVISDETILLYANLAQQDIYKKAFPNDQILSATISFSGGVGALPTRFGTLYGSPSDSSGNNFFPELSIEDFAKQTLPQSVTIEGGTIKVYPISTGSLTVKYYPTFADISSSVNPTINSYFHELIVYGIIFRCYEDLQDESLAAFYRAKYDKDLEEKMAIQSNYEEGNQRSSQLFGAQTLISESGQLGGDPNFF
jgi:hypothetical protein